jgi:hypothetical protein
MDDAIAATVDATAGRQAIEAALKAAWEASDDTVVKVVLGWLEEARIAPGKAPTSRDVAERAGLSHSTVINSMKKFQIYLPGRTPDS